MYKLIKWHRPEMINTIWIPYEWFLNYEDVHYTVLKSLKFGLLTVTNYELDKFFVRCD
jgi:hypothetical protein